MGSVRPVVTGLNAHYRRAPAETVKVPQMAESISEGTLKSWLKQPGEAVQADEEVATIETDKVCAFHRVMQRNLSSCRLTSLSTLPKQARLSSIWPPKRTLSPSDRTCSRLNPVKVVLVRAVIRQSICF